MAKRATRARRGPVLSGRLTREITHSSLLCLDAAIGGMILEILSDGMEALIYNNIF